MKLMIKRLQAAYSDQSEKLTIPYKVCIERICYQYFIPVVGSIPVVYKDIYFRSSEWAVFISCSVLNITQVIFILAFWDIFFFNKIIAKVLYRMCFDDVHELIDNW